MRAFNLRENLGKLAVILLVITNLYSTFLHWRATIDVDRGAEALDTWESRLQPVREALPVKRGVIGFVGDWDVSGVSYSLNDLETEYILTQYALAPLVLVKGPVSDWNVAILSREAYRVWEQDHPGEFEVIPFGHNIYLLHRRADP